MFTAAAEAEEADERIVAADDETPCRWPRAARPPQVHVGQQPQRLVQPPRHADRPHGDQFLHRAQRADRRAERPAEEQREQERQREERDDRPRESRSVGSASASVTFWIAPIGQMQPSRTKPSQTSEPIASGEQPPPRPRAQREVAGQRRAASTSTPGRRTPSPPAAAAGLESSGSAWSVKSGGGNRSMPQAMRRREQRQRPRQGPASEASALAIRVTPCGFLSLSR